MANQVALQLWADMKKDPANKVCVECGGNDPTWASGIYPFNIPRPKHF